MKSLALLLMAFTVGGLAIARGGFTNEPAAASLAFNSQDPVVLHALDLMKSGKFVEAEASLGAGTNQLAADMLRAHSETLDIIQRTRIEYSLDADGLLAKVRKVIPDATAEEVERWAKEGGARYQIGRAHV